MSEEQPNNNNNEQQGELFPEPDYTDTKMWVKVETAELIRITRGNDAGREVLSGRILVSFRRRTEADGDVEVIREKPKSTVREEPQDGPTWPKWNEPKLRVDPRVVDRRPIRGWSLGRNSGCLRADGSIEP